MSEPRKPVFGFLWPKPDPDAPVDEAYHQVRPVRVVGRGLIRVIGLVLLSAITVVFVGSALMAAFVTGDLIATVIAGAIGATLTFLVLRGWIVGTFVSDDAVRIETTWRRREIPWREVASVDDAHGQVPFLGSPVHVAGRRSFLVMRSGERIATHVYTSSPDLWLRAEAFDMARLRLARWGER